MCFQNPADNTSIGVNASTLMICLEWIRGPEFLWMKEQDLPQNSITSISSVLSPDDPEVKKTLLYLTLSSTMIKSYWSASNLLLQLD